MGIVAGSYVRDNELLENLRFSKNLIQVILAKSSKNLCIAAHNATSR